MKKIIVGKELEENILTSIDLLSDTVKKTLGPEGGSAIINNSSFSPFITNDGVTLARNISSDDPIINTILELAKESSIKTDEEVGDGTTTTLVLFQSLLHKLYALKNSYAKVALKEKLQNELDEITSFLNGLSHKASSKDLYNVATVAAKNEEIGRIVSEVYNKIQIKEAISLTTTLEPTTKVTYYNGYVFDTNIASDYFFKDKEELELNDTYFIVTMRCLSDLEEFADIINEVVEKNKSLVIFATDYTEDFINTVLSLNLDEKLDIYLLKNPEYGLNQLGLIKDLCTTGDMLELKENYSAVNLGTLPKIIIRKDKTIINYEENPAITSRIKELNELLTKTTDTFLQNTYLKRLAMLKNGLATIYVGGKTITEAREKKMRYEDALGALFSLESGIIPGSGLTLMKISSTLDDTYILKEPLKEPFYQILRNAGEDTSEIEHEIITRDYRFLYNITERKYEEVTETNIIDSTKVMIKALSNAISIALLLFTTESLIINEYQEKLLPNNEYNI